MRMAFPWTDAGLAVFLFCLATAAAAAWLLLRSFRHTRERLQFWSSLCFVLLALNSAETLLDYVLPPRIDLLLLREVTTLAAVGAILYGFVWAGE